MKTRSTIALHVAAVAALSLVAGCNTVQPRGRGSVFGKETPTEGDATLQPGQSVNLVQKTSEAASAPEKTAAIRPAAEVGQPGTYPEFVGVPENPHGLVVHAKDVPTTNLPKPVTDGKDAAPAKTGVTAPAAPKVVKVYTVVAGDSLGSIAQKHGVRVSDLGLVNNISDPNRIRPGQKINIPAPRPKKANDGAVAQAPAGGTIHTVAAGETIGGIAHRYGLKTGAVLRANNLTEESAKRLFVGKKLVIPAKTAENAYGGAVKKPAPVDTVKDTATTTPPKPVVVPTTAPVVPVSQPTPPKPVIVPPVVVPTTVPVTQPDVPAIDVPPPPAPQEEAPVAVPAPPTPPAAIEFTPPAPTETPAPQASTYTVREGDSLSSIALRFNTTTTDLILLNGFSVDATVAPGQEIKVP